MSKLAIVTGASSGIGNAFVRRLAADGYDLVAVGRRRDRLEDLASSLKDVKVQPLIADLSTGQDGADRVADMCNSLHLTMLVNSAGVPHYMPMTELPSEKACELVHVKVVAPTMLIRATVPGMVARGEGTIINVAGMIVFSGPAPQEQLPRRVVYAGTPAHLVAMTQVLHEELKAEGLRIQVLCPVWWRPGFTSVRDWTSAPCPGCLRMTSLPPASRAWSWAKSSAAPAWRTPAFWRRCLRRIWPPSVRKPRARPAIPDRPSGLLGVACPLFPGRRGHRTARVGRVTFDLWQDRPAQGCSICIWLSVIGSGVCQSGGGTRGTQSRWCRRRPNGDAFTQAGARAAPRCPVSPHARDTRGSRPSTSLDRRH